MHKRQQRLRYIDGMRGIAIALVVVYHFWGSTGTSVLPLRGGLGSHALVRLGWVGVELFFLISGYVILLTLERCTGLIDFAVRRWLRLFPAMLTVTGLLLLVNWGIVVPDALRTVRSLDWLPGVTFIPPALYHVVLHRPITSIDPSFWSLYVEVVFYAVFGAMYFLLGWRRAVAGLLILDAATLLLPGAVAHLPALLRRAPEPLMWLGFNYFGWFAAGICFAKAREQASNRLTVAAALIGIGAVFTTDVVQRAMLPEDRAAMAGTLVLFMLAEHSEQVRRALAWRPLLFLGAISYPLYLLHQRLGLIVAWHWAKLVPATPALVVPFAGLAVVVLLAWIIATWIEPVMKARLLRSFYRIPAFAALRSG